LKKDSISLLPRARKEKLIVKEVDGETLVYDLANDRAHCLNQTAAQIWKYCDGKRSISEIAGLMSTPGNAPVADAVVLLALDQLQKFELLETNDERAFQLAGMNRRELVRRVGLGALALPLILSIAAPTPAQTASQCACSTSNCRPIGCACTNPSQCVNHPGSQCSPVTGLCI
jgi:hypothetical protein